jgi:YD repeat-containing protein
MVWTRSGPYLHFDEDNGFPSPGFRLGFPSVQRRVFNAQTARNAYLLITSSGQRVELRQVGTSNVYDAADSSYLQLTDNSPNLLLRATDGTQLSFVEIDNEYRCTQVKDRNGNYLTINHNALGQIATVADTLGRVINFNYDAYANLLSLTQSWNGQPAHQWVSFGWSARNVQPAFTSGAVVGTAAGALLPVITQVTLNDTSHFTFEYTNSLQVSAIKNYFGTLERNATGFTYETPAGDVPRLIDSRMSARNWSGVNGLPAQIITTYNVAGDGACVLTTPDGTVYKEYYGAGWQKGLPVLSEVWSGGVRQKWTTTVWTQDNPAVGYEVNPRVIETNVYDASGNRRRTVIDYGGYAQYGLPYWVKEYGADGVTEIRHTFTDYNLSQAYLDRRIIGLVSEVHLTNISSYQGKISYAYDDPARLQALPAAATQHDSAYNTSFTARGNVTSVSRWDFTDINNAAKKLTSYTNYSVTGTPVSTTDASGHQSSVSYADSFSDSVNRNTFAYPTTSTDPGGFSSYVQYNYDFAATTRTQSPAPAGQTQGAIQTLSYNGLGQLERITTANNGAYKRFWYGADYVASYATVNNVADELYSIEVTDGLGRVIGAAGNHPGSSGGYRLVNRIYDQMGRLWKQSNPTEVNGSWAPSGDDVAGFYYTQQSYDWKGRPLVTTNTDLTTKTASYAGCGCAGGEVLTLTDEGTLDGGVVKRRQQKIYSDVLGRSVKTEMLNWQGGSVYSTAVTAYNVRDQVTQVREYAGAEGSGTYQDTVLTYDGYGRLKTRHAPEQSTGTATVWTYNADDTINTNTDARGAVTTFGYNSRHLVTSVTHTLTGQPNVTASFAYDAAGNRTSMTDSLGATSYSYDQLSRLTSEIRGFTGVGNYPISYVYNLANDLNSLTAPSNTTINYTRDMSGRLTSITRPGQTLASAISYRASGAMKHMLYGDNSTMDVTFNPRLQPATFTIPGKISKTYAYHADGALRFSSDALDHRFDRSYGYDQAGRMTNALSGAEARGEGTTTNRPYNQSYGFDAFGHMSQRTQKTWWTADATFSQSFVNNRRVGWTHDANGRVVDAGDVYAYDAAGRINFLETSSLTTATMSYDANGQQVKTIETWVDENLETQSETKYYVRSTLLGGQVVNEIDEYGALWRTFVYAGPAVFGWLWHTYSGAMMTWEQRDPSGATVRGIGEQELDPLGADAGTVANTVPPTERALVPYHSSYNPSHPNYTYSLDGIREPLEGGPTVGTNSFGFTIGNVGNPDEPFFPADWHPDFVRWLLRNQRQMTTENFSSLGIQWLTDYIIGPPFDENGIRHGLKKALNNPDCVQFLDSVLNAVAEKRNPLLTHYTQGGMMGLFEALMSKDRLTRNAPPGSAGYGSPYGTIGKGNAPIFVPGSWDESPANRLQADVKGVLNELLHVAGQKELYSDLQLAGVVHRDYPKLSKSIWPGERAYKFRNDARKNPNHIGWSYYFHYAVNTKCF